MAELAQEHQLALIALVECGSAPQLTIDALAAAGMPGFVCAPNPSGQDGDIKLFSQIKDAPIQPVFDDPNSHVTIRRVAFKRSPDLLLAVVHSQSKRNWSASDQLQGVIRLARRIDDAEQRYRHRRTLLVGDLNMNPFEDGIVGSEGLHGVMTKATAKEGSRIVDGEPRHFFYNPMWQFFGERLAGPPGTHFYAASGKPVAFFWNIFDQVLVRPELVDHLTDVRIVDRVGNRSLLRSDGQPDPNVGSDHLPLVFTIEW